MYKAAPSPTKLFREYGFHKLGISPTTFVRWIYSCWICCLVVSLLEVMVISTTKIPELSFLSPYATMRFGGGDLSQIRCTPLFLIGCFLVSLGATIRLLSYQALGHLFTFEMSIRKDHKLITKGPYRWVRHPGYTGIMCFVAGAFCCHASSGSWLRESGLLHTKLGCAIVLPFPTMTLGVVIGLLGRTGHEDAALKETFGAEWDKWAERVRYKLVPFVY